MPAFELHHCGVQVGVTTPVVGATASVATTWETVNGSVDAEWKPVSNAPIGALSRVRVEKFWAGSGRTAAGRSRLRTSSAYSRPLGSVRLAAPEIRELRSLQDGSAAPDTGRFPASQSTAVMAASAAEKSSYQAVCLGGVARERLTVDS